MIESPRFVAAIVANIKSFGAAIPQVTRGVGQRIHGIKEANYVWFRFSVIVILAHEVEQAVISLVDVDGEIARLKFGCQKSRVNITNEVEISIEVLDKRWISQ